MSREEGTILPVEVIDDIRNGEYLLDVDGESEKVRRGARSLQEKLNRTLKLLSDDLYAKKTHFILELIQNADDNAYPSHVAPSLTFKLTPDRLVVVNNEAGFTEKNVRALCDVGKSSKTKKTGYIGEKGIGFKSVFTVSSAPEIHSNGYHFRFDRSNESDLLGYVVPIWCDPVAGAMEDETTIILPAKAGYEFTADTVADVDSNLLLFLSKIRELKLERAGSRIAYRRSDSDSLSSLTTHREEHGAEEHVESVRFVRVETPVGMKSARDEKRPDFDNSTVVMAFPVDAAGAASPQPASQVFAFLPVRSVGFRFSIQADFILSASREDIHTDRPWNKRLRDVLALAFSRSVEQFKSMGALAFTYLKFVPADSEVVDPFFKPVVEQTIQKLREAKCLPSACGEWKLPKDLRYGGTNRFRELFPSAVVVKLFGFDYVDARVQADEALLKKLGASPILFADYVNVFKLQGEWFKAQPLEWKAKFYGFLAERDIPSLLRAGLASASCVPTVSGELVAPEKVTVFYPLSRRKKYGFESELTIVDQELLDAAAAHSLKVTDLFTALGIKFDDPYELVTLHILPKHAGEAWKDSEHKSLIGHLRYVKEKLSHYVSGAAQAGKTEAQALQTLREGMWVGTKQREGKWLFNRAENLYISKEYKPEFCIETLLGADMEASKLVSADYLGGNVKDVEADVESWRVFLERMGAPIAPKLTLLSDGDFDFSSELKLLCESPQSSVRTATLECLDKHWYLYSGRLTYSLRSGRSSMLLGTIFSRRLRSINSPTQKKVTLPISQCYYPTPELKDLFGDRPTYVDATLKSSDFLDACGLTYRVDAKACIKRLEQLKTEGGDTKSLLHDIYRHLERFWDKESAFIKQAFMEKGLIRVKGAHSMWARPEDVTWRSTSPFLDSLYPPLLGQYRDYWGFFIDKLGVARELATAKLVQALTRLHEVESADERRREALTIYRRCNRDLMPKFGRDEVSPPSWIATFKSELVFINQRDELVGNDGSLFANDAPEFSALFNDHPEISLLAVPFEEVPRVGRLLREAGVPLISKSLSVEVVEAANGKVRDDLTTTVRSSVPFLGRIVYARDHDRFEKAFDAGLFARLREIEVVDVSELNLNVTLAGITRQTSADVAFNAERILVKAGARSMKSQLAIELCRFLGVSEELVDTVSLVLMTDDAMDIEDFLRVRRIGSLPEDVQALLIAKSAPPVISLESEDVAEKVRPVSGADDVADTQVETGPPSSSEYEAPIETFERIIRNVGSVEPHQSGKPGHLDLAQQGRQVPNPVPESVPPPPSTEVRKGATLISGPTTVSPTLIQSEGIPEVSSSVRNPSAPSAPQGNAPAIPNLGEFGRPAGVPGNSARRPAGPRWRQRRARSGRLLSYAGSPQSMARDQESENPEKTAANHATGKAAVDYFLLTQSGRWQSLTQMPHTNPGFDVRAVAHDGSEEFIEVKGQSAAWTEEGVGLTPTELLTAHRMGERYWLCVVEYVHDESRRVLHLVKNPFGSTQQFRFDSGWRSAAISETVVPLKPEPGIGIEIPSIGRGRILGSRGKGQFVKLHIILEGGGQVHKLFNPATMKLIAE